MAMYDIEQIKRIQAHLIDQIGCPPAISIGSCTPTCNTPAPEQPKCFKKPGVGKEKKKMFAKHDYNDMDGSSTTFIPTDQAQRDFLLSEVSNVSNDLWRKAHKKFGFATDERPSTLEELLARIAAGKYVLPDEKALKKIAYYYDDMFRHIVWRDPSIKEDQAGYDKFIEARDNMEKETRRTIVVKSPEEGLAALVAFESMPIQ